MASGPNERTAVSTVIPAGTESAAGIGSSPAAVRVIESLELPAAMRLVSAQDSDREAAARRLLAAAPRHGIEFRHAWVTLDPRGARNAYGPVVRQVCLAIPGAGRTAMVFLSEPTAGGDPGGDEVGLAERMACLRGALGAIRELRDERGEPRVVVAQGLPEPNEDWAIQACLRTGFVKVGNLTYMRAILPSGRSAAAHESSAWPAGVSVVSAAGIPESRRDAVLIEALDSSYENTLDCPELCGMRQTRDILESHRKTGVHDPAIWWVVFEGQSPRGCMLLARCPEQGAVELVYLGLAPVLRGRKIARRLMDMALRATADSKYGELMCAVDQRNAPAVGLYESCGLRAFAQRVALVCAVGK